MMEVLRIATAGSVDDGKSTLIGRLLLDSKTLFDDVMASARHTSMPQNSEYLDLTLFTDGLRAEREQGITIDVAYRYFATPKRKFILADTPGHVQYTRNMVTGASTAQVALIIIDARNGVVEQSRRHAILAALLGIRYFVVCINKMDLVNYDQQVFAAIRGEFQQLLDHLMIDAAHFVPMSALHGDNVVEASHSMPWYTGDPLLQYLEELQLSEDVGEQPLRLPIQYVIHPLRNGHYDYRGYAGTVSGGVIHKGQQVRVLPSGINTVVTSIEAPWGEVDQASNGMAVTVSIADDIDISRGDMISDPDQPPAVIQAIDATVCWMSDRSELRPETMLRVKHTTRTAKVVILELASRIDVTTLSAEPGPSLLRLNEIGHVSMSTSRPLMCDDYEQNRVTGSFILIDEYTNDTVAAGMIGDPRFGHRLSRRLPI